MPSMGGMSRTPGGQVMQQPMRGGPMMSQPQGMMQPQGMRNRMQGMQGMQQPPQGMQPPMGMSNGHRMPLQPGGPMGLHQQGPPGPPGYQNQWNGPNQQMGNYYNFFTCFIMSKYIYVYNI